MMLLVSGATKTMARISDPRLGRLLRPGNGNRPDHLPWAADNGAFAGFQPKAFETLLGHIRGAPGCLWVACPDVVADFAATLTYFAEWEPRLHADGFPVAFVTQDGLTPPVTPWDSFECLFVGGSDDHKLGIESRRLVSEAKRRGKLVHVGRVNSLKRITYAMQIEADSFDGGQFSRFPDTWIPWALERMPALDAGKGKQRWLDL